MARFFSIPDAPEYIRSKILYERKPVTDMWTRLTAVARQQWKWKNVADKKDPDLRSCRNRMVQIYGPPGSGKSSASFAWVQRVCETCHTKVLWISCATETEQCCSIEGVEGVGRATIHERATPQTAADMIDATIVAFDGIRAGNAEEWRGQMNELAREGIVVIVVSSEFVRFHEGDSGDIMKMEYVVPSWTLDEYFGACSNGNFWKQCWDWFQDGTADDDEHRRVQLMSDKFVVAGHSARLMFNEFENKCKTKILGDADAMGGIDALERAVRSPGRSGALNILIAWLQTNKNGVTPREPAEMPTKEDLEAAGVARADFGRLQAEFYDGLESPVPRLVSDFASAEVVKRLRQECEL